MLLSILGKFLVHVLYCNCFIYLIVIHDFRIVLSPILGEFRLHITVLLPILGKFLVHVTFFIYLVTDIHDFRLHVTFIYLIIYIQDCAFTYFVCIP